MLEASDVWLSAVGTRGLQSVAEPHCRSQALQDELA